MRNSRAPRAVALVTFTALVCASVLWQARRAHGEPPPTGNAPAPANDAKKTAAPGDAIEVPPPPISADNWPCSSCHEKGAEYDKTKRELSFHDEQQPLQHDPDHRWCLDCHSGDDRDNLHLASGQLLPFTESYELCGQCHGEKYRDWKAGVHGRRTGHWDGHKTYLLCVNCHNPHSPKFKPLKPEPPPLRPENLVRK